jgi:glycosyltransferase involved in cell wall biosynthesis
MSKKLSITAIILTYNEEIHLQRCIDSIKNICEKIIVIDSFSKDSTEKIVKQNNVDFYQNKWVNYATQFNWGLKNTSISSDWVLRIDADEYLLPELQLEISDKIENLPKNISGIELFLRRFFLGRHIKRGLGNIKMIRLFRTNKAFVESRWMDEHIKVIEGDIIVFDGEFADHNLNNIAWWTEKHNGYSIREAIDLLNIEFNLFNTKEAGKLNNQSNSKRKKKVKYVNYPLFLRCFIYFIYRYFFKLGFLEGKEGFLWHFLQGWWYRTLVDSKIYEIKKACGSDVQKMKEYIKRHYNIELS